MAFGKKIMREVSFTKYRKLREKGASADDAYLQAKKDGLSDTDRTKMLISIYLISYREMVRISRAAGDAPPSILDDPALPPAVRAAVSRARRKKPNQSSQRNAMIEPISVFESRSSRG